jgi:NhaP-type Na+/H+ or K+/H+ antiporter
MLLSPRGLASIVFCVIFMGQNVAGTETLAAAVVCMVTFSILGHDLTANLFVAVYAALAKTDPNLGT